MGMSASQARLLSITSRLTNNEFRSQTITNSKLRLAEKSEEASAEYMDALNSQQLVFGVYSDNGEYTTQKLTPALIYDYAPLKNQYALVNPAGKMLVSNVDAKNFEATINKEKPLSAFLDKYGLLETKTYKQKKEIDNPNYEKEFEEYKKNKPLYDDYLKYLDDMNKYNKDYKQWEIDHKAWKVQHDAWTELNNLPDLYGTFSAAVGTSTNPISGTGYCYKEALNGNAGCYLHLLNHILDYDGSSIIAHTYTTTTGQSVTTGKGGVGGMGHVASFKDISDALNSENFIRYCDEDDDLNIQGKQNILKQIVDGGGTPTELDKLKSDFKINDDDTYTPKTLKEKAIDLYYLIDNGLITDATEMKDLLINFTDGDMKKLTPEEPVEPPEPQEPTYVAPVDCPIMPSKKITVYEDVDQAVVNDKDKAQWYTNLWYMMNGSDTVNKIKQKEIFDDEKNESYSVFIVDSAEKSGKGGTYEVFEDLNLFKSDSWLQFALEHGMVTMVQAQYDNPAADSGKVPELTSEGITWKSIIYTNASDIRSQEDEVAIALAEVKYKNAIREIENKDKKFDQDLKKLDTEHTALQTEYDSIKEVISKNVDRSFKAFS